MNLVADVDVRLDEFHEDVHLEVEEGEVVVPGQLCKCHLHKLEIWVCVSKKPHIF